VFEIITQQNGGGYVVDGFAPGGSAASSQGNGLAGFPAREALVHHFGPDMKSLSEARGEARCFGGHIARFAGDMEGITDNDVPNRVAHAQFAQALQIGEAIFAHDYGERLRRQTQLVGKGKPNSLAAIVHRKNAAGLSAWLGSIFAFLFHYSAHRWVIIREELRPGPPRKPITVKQLPFR
jgi:hypothetical protein